MNIKGHPFYGHLDCDVHVANSTVDSYITRAWSEHLDRELNDDEIAELQEEYSAEVQEYAWQNGSVNHN